MATSNQTTSGSADGFTDAPIRIAVSTVRPVEVPKGQLSIVAATRATTDKATGKKKEIPADQRQRCILIPEFTPNVSSKYVSIVCAALTETAKMQLAEQWEQNPMLATVDAAAYTEDSLLLFSARAAESRKLTSESILSWFKSSKLRAEFEGKYNAKQIARFEAELENIAAPVLSADFYNEEKALRRIVALCKHEEDAAHDTCISMVAKLQRYVDKIRKQREEIGSVDEIPE